VYSYAAAPLALTVGRPVGDPAKPLAGKVFAVSAPVARSDGQPFAAAAVGCKARAGTAVLRATGRAANGAARCSMRIPGNAKGKNLRGTITVSVPGVPQVTRAFAFRIG
jgi:hypothetical protein